MATIRNFNFLPQMRWDLPHFRLLESSITGDFDLLANMLVSQKAEILQGFKVVTSGAVGKPADQLQIVTANSTLIHPLATENGSFFAVPPDRSPEILSATNARVQGSFAANKVNYVGVDLRRQPDPATADLVFFLDANTITETAETVPLARTLDYVITISTIEFASTPLIAPIAKVATDANNLVTDITDARQRFFRLGQGGSVPNKYASYGWPGGRREKTTGDVFSGGDKEIGDLKSSLDAIMTRLWEIGGGEFWYSATADRNVNLTASGATFPSNNEYFEWGGTNLHWKGLKFVFDNSLGWYNAIKDQTTDLAGLTDLADGDCIYVELDRTQNRSGGSALQPVKGVLATLGAPTIPGSRFVIAVRIGSNIWTRGAVFPVGSFSALVPLSPDPSGTYAYATVTVDNRGRVTAATDNNPIPASDVQYAGGGTWADATTNPTTSVENQLDRIVSLLAAVTNGNSGADKIGSGATVNMAASTLFNQLSNLDQNAGRKNLPNTWIKLQTFDGDTGDTNFALYTSAVPSDRKGLWVYKVTSTVNGRMFSTPAGWEMTFNADWTGTQWQKDDVGDAFLFRLYVGDPPQLRMAIRRTGGAGATFDDTDWQGDQQLDFVSNGLQRDEFDTLTTTDATPQVIWQYEIPTNGIMDAEIVVLATDGTTTGMSRFSHRVTAINAGGTASVVRDDVIQPDFSVPGYSVTLNETGTMVQVIVTGASATTVTWKAFVKYRST